MATSGLLPAARAPASAEELQSVPTPWQLLHHNGMHRPLRAAQAPLLSAVYGGGDVLGIAATGARSYKAIPLASLHARVMHTVANSNSSICKIATTGISLIHHCGHTELHKFGFASHFAFVLYRVASGPGGLP